MKGFRYSATVACRELDYSAPVLFRGDIRTHLKAIAGIGYDAVELHVENPVRLDVRFIKELLEENHIALSAVATGLEYSFNKLSLIDDDRGKRQAAIERLCEHIIFASHFHCPVIIGCMRGNIPECALAHNRELYIERLFSSLTAALSCAQNYNVNVVLEAINYYVNNYLNTLSQTDAFIQSVGNEKLRLHIDTHHMNIEEKDMMAALRSVSVTLGYVHFSDSNRMYPGAGNIDFFHILQVLNEIAYDGYIAMEITPFPDGETAARNALSYVKGLEEAFGEKRR